MKEINLLGHKKESLKIKAFGAKYKYLLLLTFVSIDN